MPSDQSKIEKRVQDFIQDYFDRKNEERQRARDIPCPIDELNLENRAKLGAFLAERIARAQAMSAELAQRHWKHSKRMKAGEYAAHDPEDEKISTVEIKGQRASVETKLNKHESVRGYQYKLEKQDGEWKIAGLIERFGDDVVPAGSNDDLLKIPFPKTFNPADACNLDFAPAFQDKATMHGESRWERIEVREMGKLSVPSGRLVVVGSTDLRKATPLAIKIPPGKYPITLSSTASNTAGAVRLHWGKLDEITDYLPAKQVKADSSSVSVDRGSLVIADAKSILSLTEAERDHLWNDLLEAAIAEDRTDRSFFFRKSLFLAAPRDSGGSFPMYFGINDRGEPLCLVIDLRVYGIREMHQHSRPYNMKMKNGPLTDNVLDEFGLLPIHLRRRGWSLTIVQPLTKQIDVELLNLDGKVLEKPGSFRASEVMEAFLEIPADFTAGTLRFSWGTWRSDLEKGVERPEIIIDSTPAIMDPTEVPFYQEHNTPSSREFLQLLKAIPELHEFAVILETQKEISPQVRLLEAIPAGVLAQLCRMYWSEAQGVEAAINALNENENTWVMRAKIECEVIVGTFYLESHTGKIITGMLERLDSSH